MNVTFSVCCSDEKQALQTLEWAYHLDGQLPYDCILSIGEGVNRSQIIKSVEKLFRSLTALFPVPPIKGNPQEMNWAWQEMMRHVYEHHRNESVMVWEPDAIPLKRGWLTTIEQAHIDGGNPFAGSWHHALGFMERIGVWPGNFQDISPERGMMARAVSFDRICGDEVRQAGVTKLNHLIQCIDSIRGFPPSFDSEEDLKLLKPTAVLFHRNKDGTLIEQLSKRNGLVNKFKRLFAPKARAPKHWSVQRGFRKQPEAFFQLGRFGDLILLLPAFKEWADRSGERVVVVVSERYASVLEGVSYVQSLIVPHDSQTEAGEAWKFAKALYPNIRRTQLYGVGLEPLERSQKSWSMDAWSGSGLSENFYYVSTPLFDKRNPQREAELITDGIGKVVLVNLHGTTSPLPDAWRISGMLIDENVRHLDLASVGAHRIYDLLGLMDKAAGLITIDTATLHLAAASNVPTIHLVRDGIAGSIPKGNVAAVISYSKVEQELGTIQNIVANWIAL